MGTEAEERMLANLTKAVQEAHQAAPVFSSVTGEADLPPKPEVVETRPPDDIDRCVAEAKRPLRASFDGHMASLERLHDKIRELENALRAQHNRRMAEIDAGALLERNAGKVADIIGEHIAAHTKSIEGGK